MPIITDSPPQKKSLGDIMELYSRDRQGIREDVLVTVQMNSKMRKHHNGKNIHSGDSTLVDVSVFYPYFLSEVFQYIWGFTTNEWWFRNNRLCRVEEWFVLWTTPPLGILATYIAPWRANKNRAIQWQPTSLSYVIWKVWELHSRDWTHALVTGPSQERAT